MTVDPHESTSFTVACPHCGSRFRVMHGDLGQERNCPDCKGSLRIPSLDIARRARKATLAKAEFSFRCKLCGTRIYANPTQVGTTIACPDCHTDNRIPDVPTRPTKKQRIRDDDDPYRLQDDGNVPASAAMLNPLDAIRLHCGKCDAMMYAREDQVGKFIPCVDCGALVLVRPQSKRKKTVVTLDGPAIDLEPTTERVEEVKSLDRFVRAGTAHADRVVAERPRPPKRPFLSGVYTFPLYPEILLRWIALSALFMMLVPFISVAAEAKGLDQIIAIVLFVLFVFVLFILVFAVSTYLMTILYFTAGGYNRVADWPRLDFFERVVYVLYPAAATIASTAPLGLLFYWLPWFGSAAVQLLGIAFLFPIALLSMIDSASPAMPYSRLVWSSLRILPLQWFKFYLATVPLWIIMAGWVGVAIYWPNVWVVASIYIGILLTATVFFRLIGRLAWVLDQKMPVEDEVEEEE